MLSAFALRACSRPRCSGRIVCRRGKSIAVTSPASGRLCTDADSRHAILALTQAGFTRQEKQQ
jgi:hypothetical protein